MHVFHEHFLWEIPQSLISWLTYSIILSNHPVLVFAASRPVPDALWWHPLSFPKYAKFFHALQEYSYKSSDAMHTLASPLHRQHLPYIPAFLFLLLPTHAPAFQKIPHNLHGIKAVPPPPQGQKNPSHCDRQA